MPQQLPVGAATRAFSSTDWPLFNFMLPQPGAEKARAPSEFAVNFEARANKLKPGQSLSGLQQILNFEFADVKPDPQKMMERIEEFEHLVEQYETISTLGLDNEMKMAAITPGILEKLKAAVYSNPGSFDTYDKVKDT